MKQLFVFAFAMILALTGAQAQKKNNVKSSPNAANALAVSHTAKVIDLPRVQVGLDTPLIEALNKRCTTRNLSEDELSLELISSLLWSAYGFNRPEESMRVVPSAVNVQEYDIYVFLQQGAYLYNAEKNNLTLVAEGDHRAAISEQKHFAVAPVSIVMVANFDRMSKFKDTSARDFYAAVDCGYISQNIYLFCASADLGTVACGGINRDALTKILKVKNGKAMLAHPVGIKM